MVDYQTTNRNGVEDEYAPLRGFTRKSICWSAVFAGVVISMVIYLLLIILGTAIGASTIDPLKEQDPLEGIGIGAAVWTGLSMLIAIAAGGFISGKLARREGALHGILMFGVNTLICTGFLFLIANGAVTGVMNTVGAGLQAAGSGISAAAPAVTQTVKEKLSDSNFNFDGLQNEIEAAITPRNTSDTTMEAGRNNGTPARSDTAEIASFLKGLTERNEGSFQPADRETLKKIIISRTGKSDAEADQIVAQTEKNYQQARAKYEELKKQVEQKAREAGEKAAAATAKASWFTFFMLIVEAILAGIMGRVGSHREQHKLTEDQRYL